MTQNLDTTGTPQFTSQTIGDANFGFDIGGTIAGDPEIVFDTSGDVLLYSRTGDFFNFRIAGSSQVTINSTGLTAKQLVAAAPSNQIVIGGSNQYTITATPASTVTYTIPEIGSNSTFVMADGASTINGLRMFSSGIALPTTGGTASTLSNYSEFTQTTNWSGPFAATAGNFAVTVIGRVVTATLPAVVTTGNSTAASIVSATALPTWVRPANAVRGSCIVVNAGSTEVGSFTIQSTGLINFYNGAFTTNFSATATNVGFSSVTLQWTIGV